MLVACPRCGERALEGRYCDNCGAKIEKICRSCSATNRPDARFCANCGTAFEAADKNNDGSLSQEEFTAMMQGMRRGGGGMGGAGGAGGAGGS